MKKTALLPNIITAFSLCCGLFVIFRINMTEGGEITEQILISTAGILLVAAFADLLDGAVARAIKAESDFGSFFDSLADAITFGVAPSLIVMKSLSISPGTKMSIGITTAAMVYSVCGVLRLVRFNVRSLQAKVDQELAEHNKKNFTGLPIPAAASCAISANLLLASEELHSLFPLSVQARSWILFGMLIILGYLMISRWRFPSLKTLHIRVASFELVFLSVLSAVLILYGFLHHFVFFFFIVSWGYVLIALILSLIRKIGGRKLKTLEDFDLDPEEFDNQH